MGIFDDEKECEKYLEEWRKRDLKEAKAPLKTTKDCFEALGIYEKSPSSFRVHFARVQSAYRYRLYLYNLSKLSPGTHAYEYSSLMLKKVKEAYLRMCKLMNQDPEKGIKETVKSLTAERDRLLKRWKGHWCGTPSALIMHDYNERIELLKAQGG
jgi:hypothetical protein